MALDRYTRDVLIGILITVLTVIVAYAWNQIIVQAIDNYFKNNTERAWLWKILYLIALTAVILFIIFWVLPRIGFSLKQVSQNEKIKGKAESEENNSSRNNSRKNSSKSNDNKSNDNKSNDNIKVML